MIPQRWSSRPNEHAPGLYKISTLVGNSAEFQSLNRVILPDGEFQRLLGGIIMPDVFTASEHELTRVQHVAG